MTRGRMIWGVALILIGGIFLAQQLGLFGATRFPWLVFPFGILALIFLLTFVFDRRQWWALIPGCIMLGLTLMIFNDQNHFLSDTAAVALFLFSIGLPFLLIFLFNRTMWWALIPGGVLSVIALFMLISDREVSGQWLAASIFFGLAIVFALVRFATRASPYTGWATWVAVILAAIGAAVLVTGPQVAQIVGPLVLVGLGLLLLIRALRPKKQV